MTNFVFSATCLSTCTNLIKSNMALTSAGTFSENFHDVISYKVICCQSTSFELKKVDWFLKYMVGFYLTYNDMLIYFRKKYVILTRHKALLKNTKSFNKELFHFLPTNIQIRWFYIYQWYLHVYILLFDNHRYNTIIQPYISKY